MIVSSAGVGVLSLRRAPNLGTSRCFTVHVPNPVSGTIDTHLGLPPLVSHPHGICRHKTTTIGLWGLLDIGLNTIWACLQLPRGNVLSLHMCAQGPFYNSDAEFAAEIDKHMVTSSFSGLDLHLRTMGHVFGAFVLHLLRMHRIRTALRSLKIVLLRPEVKDACPVNCLCDDTKSWRTETISLADLENMEIEGVGGEDHELDFLKVIFGCAPMLKRVTVRLSDGVTPSIDWCTKINNIFMVYPSMECNVDLGQSCALT